MTITYEESLATFSEVATVDEAEALLAWLQKQSAPRLDLTHCTHLHPANLQVLMAANPVVSSWPVDAGLTAWLVSALKTYQGERI